MIKTFTKNLAETAEYVADLLNAKLTQGQNVLWLVSGGSAILLEVEIAKRIVDASRLVVALIDERFGPVGHPDSNWQKLIEAGFVLKETKLLPVLKGNDVKQTAIDFEKVFKNELDLAQYKLGIFGIGEDGHTAGILPESLSIEATSLVYHYQSETYNRITLTPVAIKMLDEAVLFAVGENKKLILQKFTTNVSIKDMPAQILKEVSLLTIINKVE